MQVAYIALGANLGDRRGNLDRGIALLRASEGITVEAVSTLIETAAVGGPADSPPYLNGAAVLHTSLTPEALLDRLLAIEAEIGRIRKTRWEPRLIDLDLLMYDQLVLETPKLKLPHPLMHTRRFVLEPLAQIAPNVVHPTIGKTVRELLASL